MPEQNIKYTVRKNKRAKNLRLSVHHDGSIVVTTPFNIRNSIIEKLVFEKRDWIYKKIKFFKNTDRKAIRVFSKEDYLKNKEKAREIVIEKVEYFKEIYAFDYNKISIRNQKTRWGSCSKKKNLNFNYRIIFLPEKMRDYIIIHEICHLLEFNHSSKFWRLVQKASPDYKEVKKQLREFNL